MTTRHKHLQLFLFHFASDVGLEVFGVDFRRNAQLLQVTCDARASVKCASHTSHVTRHTSHATRHTPHHLPVESHEVIHRAPDACGDGFDVAQD